MAIYVPIPILFWKRADRGQAESSRDISNPLVLQSVNLPSTAPHPASGQEKLTVPSSVVLKGSFLPPRRVRKLGPKQGRKPEYIPERR